MPTVGVAVAIPSPHGELLQARRADFGDPEAEAIPPHVTLLPPTAVQDGQMVALREHLVQVAAAQQPFEMILRSTGTFRPVSPVVFVMVSRGIAECEALERAVRSGPVPRELEFNYHPHVTVAHRVDEAALARAYAELADFVAGFQVTDLYLYEHGLDGVWRTAGAFPLGSAGG